MPKGGVRAGAGRPKGSINKRTARIAKIAAAHGTLPLDAMILILKDRLEADDWEGALEAAKASAPYIHPRLTSTEVKHSGGIQTTRELSMGELLTNLAVSMAWSTVPASLEQLTDEQLASLRGDVIEHQPAIIEDVGHANLAQPSATPLNHKDISLPTPGIEGPAEYGRDPK